MSDIHLKSGWQGVLPTILETTPCLVCVKCLSDLSEESSALLPNEWAPDGLGTDSANREQERWRCPTSDSGSERLGALAFGDLRLLIRI